MSDEFERLYGELRALMLRSAPGMEVTKDLEGELQLLAPGAHPLKRGAPVWFGMVKRGKSYVGYHLMPLYTDSSLLTRVPAALAKRKQGKSCFNFTRIDPALFEDLATLTRTCAAAFIPRE